MTTSHTATLFATDNCGGRIEIVNEETLFTVATISKFADGKLAEADAEFIVRACNAHDDLVNALNGLVDCISETRGQNATAALNAARAALAKADAK